MHVKKRVKIFKLVLPERCKHKTGLDFENAPPRSSNIEKQLIKPNCK